MKMVHIQRGAALLLFATVVYHIVSISRVTGRSHSHSGHLTGQRNVSRGTLTEPLASPSHPAGQPLLKIINDNVGRVDTGLRAVDRQLIFEQHQQPQVEQQQDNKYVLRQYETRTRNPVHDSAAAVTSFSPDPGGYLERTPSAFMVKYSLNHPELCEARDSSMPDVFLLVLVHSLHFNHARRTAVRDTWGTIARDFEGPMQVRLVFLLGTSLDRHENTALQNESKIYSDVIQGSFIDSYENLTYKSLMGMQWAREHCSKTRFILKTDDDVFVNIPRLLKDLVGMDPKGVLLGAVNSNSRVQRHGRWKVQADAYPKATYPPYCAGAAYIMSLDVAGRLLDISLTMPVIPVEDAHVTGILASRSGFKCKNHPGLPNWWTGVSIRYMCELFRGKLIGLHGLQTYRVYEIWKLLNSGYQCLHRPFRFTTPSFQNSAEQL